jgi:hypothetical protein
VKRVLREYRSLIALVALFLILGGIYAVVTPIFEAGDEVWHYPFVEYVAAGHGLPVQNSARKDLWEQEGGQPPLYYALSAAATFWIDTRDLQDRLWRNPYAKIGLPLAFGNKNLIVHTSAEDFPWRQTSLSVHVIRFLSLLLSACTVVLTYLLAKEIYSPAPSLPPLTKGGSGGVPLLAAALVAFNPMFLFISASVNNDSLAAALAALALLLIVRCVKRGVNTRGLLVVGIVCGLGGLTKVSDLGLIPLALLVAGWLAWRQSAISTKVEGPSGRTTRQFRTLESTLLAPALLILIPALLIAGWWYARNYLLYGDPLAFNVWLQIAGGRPTAVTLFGLISEFQGFRISFWGNFGGVNLIAPEWVYTVLDLISLAALLGLAVAAWKRILPSALWIVTLWPVIVFVGLVRWTLLTYASQGRLIFPAISAVGVLLAFGLSTLGLESWKVRRLKSFNLLTFQPFSLLTPLFLFVFAVAAPFLIIAPAYALPMRLKVDAPVPNPVHITYAAGDAQPELVGYEVGRSVRAGGELPLTLYWRAATRVVRDLYVYIHLYDASGKAIGQWEALPGNGLYPTPLWQPNELIVDHYAVPVSTETEGPQVGRIEVGLTPVGGTVPIPARNPNGETIVPSLARFKIAAPPSNIAARPALFKFGDVLEAVSVHFSGARGGRQFEIDPHGSDSIPLFGGDVLRADLTLRAINVPTEDYTIFVHLVDSQGHIAAQQDKQPESGAYPTSFWDVGEEVGSRFDLRIPDDATSGDYLIEVGLYGPGDGARLPVSGNAIGNLRTASDHLLLAPLRIGK